jgi:hypothetical protein
MAEALASGHIIEINHLVLGDFLQPGEREHHMTLIGAIERGLTGRGIPVLPRALRVGIKIEHVSLHVFDARLYGSPFGIAKIFRKRQPQPR